MPSPFPGMDPYLEDPPLWEGFHNRMIATMSTLIVAQVRPKYWVNVEQRVYIDYEEDPRRQIRPDIAVEWAPGTQGAIRSPEPAGRAEAVMVETATATEIREWNLKVLLRDGWRVVTVIELLSASNKRRQSVGRAEYLNKRQEILHGEAHLVEIDLLRGGERLPFKTPPPPGDYYAFVHRAPDRPRAEAYAISLRERLPSIPIPLLAGDPDIWLDLQRALEITYDEGAYEVPIRYHLDPAPPLPDEHVEWAKDILRAKGPG